jgi:protein-tyrosine phosphatase
MKTQLLGDIKIAGNVVYLCDDLFAGPMDNTVCDFWRMVWEQHLELILMLTNLEEYSKTKCAKYWPDEAEGDKMFGDFGVAHVREKRYSGL